MRSSASWNESDSMITSTRVGSCVSYRSIIRRLSWCSAFAYERRRKLSRSVSKSYSWSSLFSRRSCSNRSRSRYGSFCETSPTFASSERMLFVKLVISAVRRASFLRAAAIRACNCPILPLLSPAAGAARTRHAARTMARRRPMSGRFGGTSDVPAEALGVLSLRALRPRFGDDGRPGLGDDRRLRRSALVGRGIRLRDHCRTGGLLLAGSSRLLRDLDHLRRLHLQPPAVEPFLHLRDHSLH